MQFSDKFEYKHTFPTNAKYYQVLWSEQNPPFTICQGNQCSNIQISLKEKSSGKQKKVNWLHVAFLFLLAYCQHYPCVTFRKCKWGPIRIFKYEMTEFVCFCEKSRQIFSSPNFHFIKLIRIEKLKITCYPQECQSLEKLNIFCSLLFSIWKHNNP